MTADKEAARAHLIGVLQAAHSGELAAGLAYAGHWRSVASAEERERIRSIEAEEWRHRQLVGELLRRLGARPSARREVVFRLLGRVLGPLCSWAGWLLPMYGAGLLESRNIVEYEVAAELARLSGHEEFVECLLEMAEVEWQHERYFRERVMSHPLAGRLPMWREPPPLASIREKGKRSAA